MKHDTVSPNEFHFDFSLSLYHEEEEDEMLIMPHSVAVGYFLLLWSYTKFIIILKMCQTCAADETTNSWQIFKFGSRN